MKLDVLMLAAGQSQRFNGIKQLASLGGQSLIEHSIQIFCPHQRLIPGLCRFTLVLGANAQYIRPKIPPHIALVIAENWSKGMSASLAAGLSVLEADSSHVLLALADQIALTQQDIAALISGCKEHPQAIIAASYGQTVGAPVIFPRQYYPQLTELTGDQGAKSLLTRYTQQVINVAMPNAALDIDTQDDLQRARVFLS